VKRRALWTTTVVTLFAGSMGAQAVFPAGNIFETANQASELTTLAGVVKAAGLLETLEGPGPFTVFAPTNDAFAKLPFGTLDVLRMRVHKDVLTKVLTYMIVEGRLSSSLLLRRIREAHGTAQLRAVDGHTLLLSQQDGDFVLQDEQGNRARILQADIKQSNGVIHIVDAVVLPR
jgi:uncharacterized surface protein with fasciclin (FAS1) repeats